MPNFPSRPFAGLLSLGLLGVLPAPAIIVQDAADPEARRLRAEAARAAGAKHQGPVRIHFAATEAGSAMRHGSGVYLGDSADAETGYILTAAHVFRFDPGRREPAPFRRAMAWAGPEAPSGEGAVIERIHIHPYYDTGSGTKGIPLPSHDLAIATFSWKGRDSLRATGHWRAANLIEPKAVPEGSAIDAEAVGYGRFGTNGKDQPEFADGIQGGWTRVQPIRYRGLDSLVSWLGCAETEESCRESKQSLRQALHRFQLPKTVQRARIPGEKEAAQLLQAHPEQVLTAPGDSGGPLFLPTAAGPRVFGIASCLVMHDLEPEGGDGPELCIGAVWAPVAPYLEWIRAVLDGTEPPAWVLESGETRWRRQAEAGQGADDACSLCAIQ
jgi:hypothetical protein